TGDERTEEQAVVRELISTRVQLKAELNNGKPDAARVERLQGQLVTHLAKRADQQARLYARVPDLRLWRGLAPPATDINALVPDAHALVVEYLIADDEILVVSVARGEIGPDVAAVVIPMK